MDASTFFKTFQAAFSKSELRGLCFDLGFDRENVERQEKDEFARNLFLVCQRHDKLSELIVLCREKRPKQIWPEDVDIPHLVLKNVQEISDLEIKTYLAWVQKQYNTMRVLSMTQPLSLDATYTDVFLLEKGKYWREEKQESLEKQFAQRENRQQSPERIAGADVLTRTNRLFVVGQPGAGKTTFSKWLALRTVREGGSTQKLPVYVALRRFNTWEGNLLEMLAQELEASGVVEAGSKLRFLLRQDMILLLLDGLDEVQANVRDKLNDQIEDLAKMSGSCQIVITCRPYAETRRFQRFDYVQMADFTDEQVANFIKSWFFEDSVIGSSLLRDLRQDNHISIRELTQTPLLLALLCIAYQENGKFPQKRDELYSRALQVVLTQWDEGRGVKRDSAYGQLTVEIKQVLLAWIAFESFSAGELFIHEARLVELVTTFWRNWLQQEIAEQRELYGVVNLEELPVRNVEANKIVHEIVVQHGLFIEQLPSIYSFSHLTLHEYFTAQHVVANFHATLPILLARVGEESWREVFLLTSGMLHEADIFAKQYIKSLARLVDKDKMLVAFLEWGVEKSTNCSRVNRVQSVAARAFFLFLALDRAYELANNRSRARAQSLTLADDRALERTRSLTSNLSRTLDSTLDLANDLALDLAQDLAQERGHAREGLSDRLRAIARINNIALDLVVTYDLNLLEKLAGSRDYIIPALKTWVNKQLNLPYWLPEIILTVEAPPRQTYQLEEWTAFNKLLENLLLRYWRLDRFWEFTNKQVGLLNRYLAGTQVLVECLQVANVQDRPKIEAQLLLPPNSRLERGE